MKKKITTQATRKIPVFSMESRPAGGRRTPSPKTDFKYRLLESRIIHDFGSVKKFEKVVDLPIRAFIRGENPNILVSDLAVATKALGLTDIEEYAFYYPEIFFGELSKALTERLARAVEKSSPAWKAAIDAVYDKQETPGIRCFAREEGKCSGHPAKLRAKQAADHK